jgi:hypothetical protein
MSLESSVECAVEFRLLTNCLGEFCLHTGALAAREVAAPQLGPQLLDMVVKRDHRPLLPL